MKTPLSSRFSFAALTLAGAVIATCVQAQDITVNNFDSADEAAGWARWWGSATQEYDFDPSVDAANNASSGSLKAIIGFDLATYAGDNQFAVVAGFPDNATVDGTTFTNLVFDLKWDGASPKRSYGDYGYLEIGFRKSDFSQLWLPAMTISADSADKWIHVVEPIDPAAPGVDQLTGVVLKMWSGDPASGQTGTATFWVDNVKLVANTNVTIPPPTLSLEPAQSGLRLFASAGGSQYQRQNIRTVNSTYSWVDVGRPVTYSLTIKDYPDSAHTGFQTHIFLVPNAGNPTESGPDYNEPNLIFLDIQNNANGATATFRYKTNQPSGNTMVYNSNPTNGPVGTLGSVSDTTAIGTWSMTFSNNTDVTLTSPGGTTTSFSMPADAAALFANPLYAYFGDQPNQSGNIYQSATLGRVQITGIDTPIDENFAGVQSNPDDPASPLDLDSTVWARYGENNPGIVLVPAATRYWVNWTVPAAGFNLQTRDSFAPGTSWTDSTLTSTQIGNLVRVQIPATNAAGGSGFFRVIKP